MRVNCFFKHIMPKRHSSTLLFYRVSIPNLWHYIIGSNKLSLFIKIHHNAKQCVIAGAHYRENTPAIFKCLQFLKLLDLYQLQVNRYVLLFIKGLLPFSLNHIFSKLTWSKHRHSTVYKLLVKNKVVHWLLPKHYTNGLPNMELSTWGLICSYHFIYEIH